MCKYCGFGYVTEKEKSNNCPDINVIKDGSQSFVLYFSRYESKETRGKGALIMDYTVKVNNSEVVVKEKIIPIKYCPFCGEKL